MAVNTETAHLTLSDVTTAFEQVYPPGWAASWDAVGLVAGDPAQPVARILFAVDPVDAVVDEALTWGADLVITHHPLMLRGVTSVAANTPKGRIVHRLIRSGTALYTAHTNADTASPGVSDALAGAVGLTGPLRPLDPDPTDSEGRRGIGRIGALDRPVVLREFAQQVARGLPATAAGIRVAGDLDRLVTTVAVSGGAGDSLLGAARAAGVDAFVTSDLRHHPASEFVEEPGGPALIDTAHFASEWPWLADGADHLAEALGRTAGPDAANVEIRVSTTVTDAWSQAVPHV
ncbi:Nif3-like dinuclear metal center hexameric protein [Nocardiopsis sp. TSRI0078]|uniref:Nif3-like dinuclear metal center hexameric protein n=1 Tax=unclassified Nocardiopsis TaxID=2649073 RepID=UPI00093A8C5D|nr:Nif3-like dinuclear metal center hexameric protein [Nocardiopsis sp. TSRI0078]OKI17951.1 Nif3-like dinuclear metal center hexameric protein [Nocardiopsis sp. TSRI0078]